MGMCKPSGGVKRVVGRIGDLEREGTPNSRVDMYNEKGILIQQRWYGPDGYAVWDRDWKHGGVHKFPHDHYWIWNDGKSKRFEYKNSNGELVNKDYY